MYDLPDPTWYLENVLVHAEPGRGGRTEVGPAARWQAWWQTLARDTDAAQQLARGQGFVVSTPQLTELGWQRHDLRREVRRGTWWSVGRGVWSPVPRTDPDPWTVRRRGHAVLATAASLARPTQVISGRSAAILHGLPTVHVPACPELTAGQSTLGRRTRAHVFGATLGADAITSWFGAPVATVARTLVDLARHDRFDGIMAVDAALREHLLTVAELEKAIDVATGWPGVRQARRVLRQGSPLAESALESVTRLRLHDDGLPTPELQVEIEDPARRRVYRVDFLLRRARLIIEADGRGKYTDEGLWREKERETRLRALGFRVERLLWSDVLRYWPETSARLWRLLTA